MEFVDPKTIKLDKEINELDKLLLEFIRIVRRYAKYVVVSGYVSILFGRARSTEDIDVLIEPIDEKRFEELWKELEKKDFWCLNSTSSKDAFNLLREDVALRIARKGEIIPNIELSFCKSNVDFETLKERIKIVLGKEEIFISPIEMQIAYKEEKLKSKKDVEDALHLRKVFSDVISQEKIEKYKEMIRHE